MYEEFLSGAGDMGIFGSVDSRIICSIIQNANLGFHACPSLAVSRYIHNS